MRARAAVAALLLGALAPSAVRAQTTAPPALSDYAVLGIGDVTIRRQTRVLGGAVGALGGTVRIGPQARVGVVAGPTVLLGLATRTGTLFCHFVSGPPTLPTCNAFTDPLVDPALLAPVPVAPGTRDFRLPPHTGTAPVPPGSYRDVRVGAGSVLQLAGGAYSARSLRIARAARVVCATDCRLGVLGSVRLRRGAELGAAAPLRANTARVDIGGSGVDSLGPIASGRLPAFVARARANVAATIFAPGGAVVLGPLGSYRGAFIGRTVAVGPRATVRIDSAL